MFSVFLRQEMYRTRKKVGDHLCWLQKYLRTCGCVSLQGKVSESLHHWYRCSTAVRRGLSENRIRAIQELKGLDSAKRLQCCSCFRFFVEENGIKILYVVYFSAEAWFCFDGYMRSHNCGNCQVKIYTHYIRRNWCMVCAVSQSLIWSYLLWDLIW